MKTLGLDCATCTGMALVGEDEDRGKTVEIPTVAGFARLHLIASDVAQTLQIWQPQFAAVEGYAYCKNISSFVKLVEIGTVIRVTLRQMNIPWLEVPPTVLKKWTTGKGSAKKDQMALSVKQRWGFTSESHDIVDAFALAYLAQLGWDNALGVTGVKVGWTHGLIL